MVLHACMLWTFLSCPQLCRGNGKRSIIAGDHAILRTNTCVANSHERAPHFNMIHSLSKRRERDTRPKMLGYRLSHCLKWRQISRSTRHCLEPEDHFEFYGAGLVGFLVAAKTTQLQGRPYDWSEHEDKSQVVEALSASILCNRYLPVKVINFNLVYLFLVPLHGSISPGIF